MENQAKKQNQKNDWKKKGLGWVPDYPDLRDYDLTDEKVKNKLRLKTDEKTDNIEQLIDLIIESLSKENRETGRIHEIKNKILGNVVFTKIKVHKFFRYEVITNVTKYILIPI
ncbi:MAG: hypothetical protein KME38_21125 [Spirirestis rafaelensis WJT71-NPBG6]|jgi:O-phosphoseryl-tRNA(Cys) synthetase|nr:hypothetical protein [Spirirestis rafaelensis WJT71-NPBG6]